MLPRTVRVSFHLRNVVDEDESNPWIITSHHWMGTTIDEALLASDTTDANPDLLGYMWQGSAYAGSVGSYGYRLTLPSTVEWYHTEISARLAGDSPGDADFVGTFTPSTAKAGVRTGTVLPQPCALVLQKLVSGSSAHRGRNYLPCGLGDVEYDGRVLPATRTAMATAMNGLLGLTFLTANYQPIVSGSDGVRRPITGWYAGSLLGVQRRRLR